MSLLEFDQKFDLKLSLTICTNYNVGKMTIGI